MSGWMKSMYIFPKRSRLIEISSCLLEKDFDIRERWDLGGGMPSTAIHIDICLKDRQIVPESAMLIMIDFPIEIDAARLLYSDNSFEVQAANVYAVIWRLQMSEESGKLELVRQSQ